MYAVAILCILESMLCAINLTFSGFEETSVFNLNENFYFSLTCLYERQWEIMIILELTLHAHGSAVAVFFPRVKTIWLFMKVVLVGLYGDSFS